MKAGELVPSPCLHGGCALGSTVPSARAPTFSGSRAVPSSSSKRGGGGARLQAIQGSELGLRSSSLYKCPGVALLPRSGL